MRAFPAIVAVAALSCWGRPAAAQQSVPLIVQWDKTAFTRVIVQDGNSSATLPAPDAHGITQGAVTRPTSEQLVNRVTLIVSYADIDIPIVINVRPTSSKIEILLPFETSEACFNNYLLRAEQRGYTTVDAMRGMLIAAYALRIPAPNDCRSAGSEARAMRARLARNQNLAVTSRGLFALNDDWRNDVAGLPNTPSTSSAALADNAAVQASAALVATLYSEDMRRAPTAADSLAIARGIRDLAARDRGAKSIVDTVPLAGDIAVYEQRVANAPSAATSTP